MWQEMSQTAMKNTFPCFITEWGLLEFIQMIEQNLGNCWRLLISGRWKTCVLQLNTPLKPYYVEEKSFMTAFSAPRPRRGWGLEATASDSTHWARQHPSADREAGERRLDGETTWRMELRGTAGLWQGDRPHTRPPAHAHCPRAAIDTLRAAPSTAALLGNTSPIQMPQTSESVC